MVTKARRQAVEASLEPIYIEMKEPDGYGKGCAWLEEIPPMSFPPTEAAKQLYKHISKGRTNSASIIKALQMTPRGELRKGIEELIEHKAIVENITDPQHYDLNPLRRDHCDADYLRELTS